MSLKQQLLNLVPLCLVVVVLFGYNFLSAQWQGPTAVAPNNNTSAPINISASYQAKLGDLGAVRMRAGEYCNADGTVCTSDITGGGGAWGSWIDVTASRNSGTWYLNATGRGKVVSFTSGRADTEAFVSTSTSTADEVRVTSHDGDSGERTNGAFIVPPGAYYRINAITFGSWAELTLPF